MAKEKTTSNSRTRVIRGKNKASSEQYINKPEEKSSTRTHVRKAPSSRNSPGFNVGDTSEFEPERPIRKPRAKRVKNS